MKEAISIEDKVYGSVVIKDPVLVELISSLSLQRLKNISQAGIPDQFYPLFNYSRFEHSLGVLLLLKRLSASKEEQIAGLLHDVSHRAFSHVYDWVVDDYSQKGNKEEQQDLFHQEFIANSEIPPILMKYGFRPAEITDHQKFGLLEREVPDLCADRVDYSLRQFPQKLAQEILNDLKVVDSQIVCQTLAIATIFARQFLRLQQEEWGSYEATARYHYFSSFLKRALALGIIYKDDFLGDDPTVMAKIDPSVDKILVKYYQVLTQPTLTEPETGYRVFKKFRYIDPLFIHNDKLSCLSDHDPDFQNLLEQARSKNEQGMKVLNLA